MFLGYRWFKLLYEEEYSKKLLAKKVNLENLIVKLLPSNTDYSEYLSVDIFKYEKNSNSFDDINDIFLSKLVFKDDKRKRMKFKVIDETLDVHLHKNLLLKKVPIKFINAVKRIGSIKCLLKGSCAKEYFNIENLFHVFIYVGDYIIVLVHGNKK